ncbi:putative glycosyltransferase [Kiritimatiella glycovorans]|uniref:Putative glycosyltransferase n=2 Tax=Kiritimatiella glycovorans TaxID=1307763 RepID=A0A0G3EFC1_9BACT|nr:putative glycosyltransferase [Kiritimatiella glycovorans]
MHTPRTIAFWDDPLDPPGGGQFSLLTLLTHLDRDRYRPEVHLFGGPSFRALLAREGIEARRTGLLKSVFYLFRRRPDLVHCNIATSRRAWILALSARLAGVPFVWHVRIIDSAGWKDRWMARLADRIVVISEAVRARFAAERDKTVRIYNGVDMERFARVEAEYAAEEGGAERGFRIGVFSRLDPWKGHELFLDALLKLGEAGPPVEVWIAGEGDPRYRARLEDTVRRHGLTDRVRFLGHREDVPALMRQCDAVVNPSIRPEPFGRTLIEAMASGAAVVATARGGAREVIDPEKDGMLVEPEPGALAAALERLRHDRSMRSRLAANAWNKCAQQFSAEAHARRVMDLYAEMCGDSATEAVR